MEKLPISIGILSWKAHDTLINTINSYKKLGLLDIISDIKILFQEICDEDRQIANGFNIEYIGLSENIGIGKAFITLAENAECENILLLENDWVLIENQINTILRLKNGIKLLENNIHAVRYRHRAYPGHPLFTFNAYKDNELNHYDSEIDAVSPHLLDSVHWILDPDKAFPDKIIRVNDYFVTTSKWANWTNNPCMYKKSFYLEHVRSFAGSGIDLEGNIGKWWNRQNFYVAQGSGLFTHKDIIKYGS
jgi:hypothetical protein